MRKPRGIEWLMRILPKRTVRAILHVDEKKPRHKRLADLMAEARRLQAEAEAART